LTDRPSFVVTGGAQGVGRAISERLAADGAVVVLDVIDELGWHHERVQLVSGDARDPETTGRAAAAAEAAGPLTGWVNNAAMF
jgi:NAD(P)-dependent dehydrogenase (short-subunit alcohol dehydrogenase family)